MFGLGLVVPVEECTGAGAARSCTPVSRGEAAASAAVGGALIGSVIGAIIGSERWARAVLPLRVAVLPWPHGGASVALRWSR